MVRVKLTQVLMTIPVGTDGDDWDIELEESLYRLMQASAKALQRVSDACNDAQAQQFESAATRFGGGQVPAPGSIPAYDRAQGNAQFAGAPAALVSQEDPKIDTTVRDSEMRGSSEPEMTLEELRERPEKTRAPPRPRANSWRHQNG